MIIITQKQVNRVLKYIERDDHMPTCWAMNDAIKTAPKVVFLQAELRKLYYYDENNPARERSYFLSRNGGYYSSNQNLRMTAFLFMLEYLKTTGKLQIKDKE